MGDRLPLSALLSQALVAFLIEFDNEFERRTPHRTSRYGSTEGAHSPPWLVSRAMWSRFIRFVDEEGTAAAELRRRLGIGKAQLKKVLARMVGWRYITVGADLVVRPTAGGLKAMEVWRSLTGVVEERWRERFGTAEIRALAQSLEELSQKVAEGLADSLPILGYGLFSNGPERVRAVNSQESSDDSLAGPLAKVLLAFAIGFERGADVSLAISANVLRLVTDDGARVKEMAGRAGVSKEAIAAAVSFLEKRGYAAVKTVDRVKVLTLTGKGRQARERYGRVTDEIESRWRSESGARPIEDLRDRLVRLPLVEGLTPYPDGWRAKVAPLKQLPHFPMVLHRGGFPDGS